MQIYSLKGRIRNICKALIYEIVLGMGLGGLIVYFYTSSFPTVTSITGTYTVIKIVLYVNYDRLWPEYKESNGSQAVATGR